MVLNRTVSSFFYRPFIVWFEIFTQGQGPGRKTVLSSNEELHSGHTGAGGNCFLSEAILSDMKIFTSVKPLPLRPGRRCSQSTPRFVSNEILPEPNPCCSLWNWSEVAQVYRSAFTWDTWAFFLTMIHLLFNKANPSSIQNLNSMLMTLLSKVKSSGVRPLASTHC